MLLRATAVLGCTAVLLVGHTAGSATAARTPVAVEASSAVGFSVPVTALVRRDVFGAVVAVMTNDGQPPGPDHEVWEVTRHPSVRLPADALAAFVARPEDLPWRTGAWVRAAPTR